MITCPRCSRTISEEVDTCPHDGEPLPGRPRRKKTEELPAGMMVGDYRIEGPLGEGGFGAVYRAIHPLIEKAAAIKVLNYKCSADPVMVARFTSEARVVNQIRHRNIVDIFSFGQLPDGRHYHIMELLDGVPFDQHLKQRGRMSMPELYPLLRGIARALAAAHAAGVVHRDLKPANVFLVRDEDLGFSAKLIDFGIAKLLEDEGAHKTATGAMMGTAYYMAPEQCRGRPIDARVDIYAFGALIHVALTGRKPFEGESAMDVVMKQITEPAPPMSSVCPEVPPELDAPVLRMLEKDPAHRPQSVIEALDALADAARACGVLSPVPSGRGSLVSLPAEGEVRGASLPPDVPSPPAVLPAAADARTMLADETPEGVVAGSAAAPARASWRRLAATLAFAALLGALVGVLVLTGVLGSVAPAGSAVAGAGGSTPVAQEATAALTAALGPSVSPAPAVSSATPVAEAQPVPTAAAAASASTAPGAAPVVSPASPVSAAATVKARPAGKPPPPRPPVGSPRDELDY